MSVRTSIVVPSYRGARRLPVLLDGLAAQTDDDFEVVVVLDGSVDDSCEVLARRVDLPLRVVTHPTNQGRAAALNTGFDAALGELLIRCDDDLETPPGFVAAHVAAHEARRCGVVGPCRNAYPTGNGYVSAYAADADAALLADQLSAGPERAWRFWGANVSVTREDHDLVGPYDAATFVRYGWEDADWGYRLHRAGVPVVVDGDAWATHHAASVDTSVRAGRAYASGWSQAVFEAKHGVDLDGRAAPPATTWQRLVARYARGLDEAEVARRAGRIDGELARLPRYLARKRVALLVEAAARAGYHDARQAPLHKPGASDATRKDHDL